MTNLFRGAFVICLVGLSCVGSIGFVSSWGCDSPPATSDGPPATNTTAEADTDAASAVVTALQDDDLSASRRLAAIHRARDEHVSAAIPGLLALLDHPNADIVVAAAAALAALESAKADTAVVAAANRLSRNRQLEHLRQLLYVIADIGGPASRTYLQAVADGHPVGAIQRTAAEALEQMRGR